MTARSGRIREMGSRSTSSLTIVIIKYYPRKSVVITHAPVSGRERAKRSKGLTRDWRGPSQPRVMIHHQVSVHPAIRSAAPLQGLPYEVAYPCGSFCGLSSDDSNPFSSSSSSSSRSSSWIRILFGQFSSVPVSAATPT